jgi:hypothetical protein
MLRLFPIVPVITERAIELELVLLSWRDSSLSDLSAKELQSFFNSEYWVLSSHPNLGRWLVLKETFPAQPMT